MLGTDGRPRPLILTDAAGHTVSLSKEPRIGVNDVLTVHRLAQCGAGVAGIFGLSRRRRLRLGRPCQAPAGLAHAVDRREHLYPSSRDLAPAVRALINMLKALPDAGDGTQTVPWTLQEVR